MSRSITCAAHQTLSMKDGAPLLSQHGAVELESVTGCGGQRDMTVSECGGTSAKRAVGNERSGKSVQTGFLLAHCHNI